jgi:hypothetical protein
MCQRSLQLQIRSPFIPKTVQIKPRFSTLWQQLTAARQTRRAGLRRTCSSGSCISAVTLRLTLEQAAGWGSTSCVERARASKTRCRRLEPEGTASLRAGKQTRSALHGRGGGWYDEVRDCCWQRGKADVKPPAVSNLKQDVIHTARNNARRWPSDRQIGVVYAVCNGVHGQPEERVRQNMGCTVTCWLHTGRP